MGKRFYDPSYLLSDDKKYGLSRLAGKKERKKALSLVDYDEGNGSATRERRRCRQQRPDVKGSLLKLGEEKKRTRKFTLLF